MNRTINRLRKYLNNSDKAIPLLTWLLVLLFAASFVTKVMKAKFGLTDYVIYPSTFIKGVIFSFFALVLIIKGSRYYNKWITLVLIVFILGIIADIYGNNNIEYFERISFLLKYLFAVSSFLVFKDIFDLKTLSNLSELLKTIALINAGFILLAVIFPLEMLNTYPFTSRMGLNGIISLQGEATYFYMFTIALIYVQWWQGKEKLWKLSIIVISAALVGTKALWLFLFLLGILHLLYTQGNKILKIVTAIGIVIMIASYKIIWKTLLLIFPYAEDLVTQHGYGAFFTSKRNLLFNEAYIFISEKWSAFNFLVGGINYSEQRVEFEPVDVFLFFGMAGIALFTLWMLTVYRESSPIFKLLLSIFLLVAFMSGSLFVSITNAILFAICVNFLKQITRKNVISESFKSAN